LSIKNRVLKTYFLCIKKAVENLHVNQVILLLQFDYKTIILFESIFLHFDNMVKKEIYQFNPAKS